MSKLKKEFYKTHKHPSLGIKRPDAAKRMKGNKLGYITGHGYEPYPDIFNENLKESIRKRDNYKCQKCGKKQTIRRISVHHIDYNKDNCKRKNLITLCHKCNIRANYNRDYWFAYFRYIKDNF